jgi:TATA-box binding protein (TBP) (component of TFIID and TFIIIB)
MTSSSSSPASSSETSQLTPEEKKDLAVSTMTVIAISNVSCDIDTLYSLLPVREMEKEQSLVVEKLFHVHKQRGRRRKETDECRREREEAIASLVHPSTGDIVGVYYKNQRKGLPQYLKRTNNFFRNALNVILMLSPTRKINFKLSKNGKFQITGCKSMDDVKQCLARFFHLLLGSCRGALYTIPDTLHIIYYSVMTNIDFNVGFKIHRQRLNHFIHETTQFSSLLETSFGYTGVNIKSPYVLDDRLPIHTMSSRACHTPEWEHGTITYGKFLECMPPAFRRTEKEKKRYNTFLVFHSGNVIMSGMRYDVMKDLQQSFSTLLVNNRAHIEEHLDTLPST